MKIRKRLIALVMMAVIVFGLLPMNVQAAVDNGMKPLYKHKIYTKYDVTGDGKKDTFKYIDDKTRGYVKVYLNGRYVQKIFMARGGFFNLCNVGKNNVYLINYYGLYGGSTSKAYVYSGNKFKQVSTFSELSGDNVKPWKLRGDTLYMLSYTQKFNPLIFPNSEPRACLKNKNCTKRMFYFPFS